MLLVIGAGNGVWAKKVTYHILTKPFDVRNHNNTGDYKSNIRVEALQCTSEEATVGLPDQFKSPLATTFRYWKNYISEKRTYDYLYDYSHNNKIVSSKYYIYQCTAGDSYACLSDEIENPAGTSTDAADVPSDIYVTYEYIGTNDILELNGATNYNVGITNSGKQKFLCYNRSRNNRVANALATGLSGEDLANDDFVIPTNDKKQLGWNWSKWGPIGVFLGFKFKGNDPYNITIETSYAGGELHITDAISNVDKTGTIKPYAGATLMSKVGANSLWFDCSNDKHYKLPSDIKDAGQWTEEKYADCKAIYEAANDAQRYDTWVGFYRYESPTMNTFCLLPHPGGDGYMFVGSKMNQGTSKSTSPTINQPNNGQYYTYYDNLDNDGGGRSQPYFRRSALSSAHPTKFYEIRTYTLKLKTKGSRTVLTKEMNWSDAMVSERIVDHVPDALRRKYAKFTGAYREEALSNAITTFADAQAAGISEIWLDYETDTEAAPFEFLPEGGSYADAHWYTMRVNGKAEQKNIAYNSENSLITGSSSIGSESDLHQGENSADAMVAFMGDPYELKIISRAASEAATTAAGGSATAAHNRYVGFATGETVGTTLKTNKTTTDSITWEIMYESTDAGNFVLRRFKTVDNPRYIGWSTASNKPVIYSSDSTRIRVVDLDKVNYTYHIMRSDETIAIKATVTEYVGKPLQSWMDIPTIIRSPFLAPSYNATVTYYANETDATNNTNAITNAPYIYTTNHDIYVRYNYTTAPTGGDYNVTLNAEYIFTSTTPGDANIYSKGSITTGEDSEAVNPAFQWVLNYSDPYAMTIQNKGKEQYVKLSSATPTDNMAFSWDNAANATLFIAKQSAGNVGFYEVMLATGEDYDAGNGVGITTTYFNVGRNISSTPESSTPENTVKLYQNTTYASGYNQLRFRLIGTTATEITYHLIDKANNDLLQVKWRHTNTDLAYFPPRFRSPLVNNYYYYPTQEDAIAGRNPIVAVGENSNIYVTYDVNELVNLKRGKLYLLKYEAGQMFNEEDGSDGISKTAHKAIYPYVNGDCNFFVYGQEQYDLQQEGAASTRTRWAWYVQSDIGGDRGDPYHVKIRSRQSESYPITNSSEYNAYFATYQPTEYDKVVTTLTWPGITGVTATEYMVLGNEGQYQLVTTNEIGGSRYVVNSFEQYWKTWDTIRKKVYGESKAKENDSDPTIIPLDTKAKFGSNTTKLLRDSLEEAGWHCYENWAYAKRWNGYNNGYSSEVGEHQTKKGWEKIEHWYQTVSMGEGYFDFVETSITPVLILLDQHGWEVMRKPLPTSPTDPQKEAKYEAIRPYNSPMVKEYAFWVTAKKRTGFHQYYLLSDRIGGDDFTSTDLTNLPPYGSKNVLDKKGNLNDQYVTYIVKDEYAQTYDPSTKTGKEFLIEQGSKYASTSNGTTITKNDVPVGGMQKYLTNSVPTDVEKWYVKPNWNIDYEMGYGDTGHSWTKKKDDGSWDNKNPNAYEHSKYKDSLTAQYISDKDSLGYFSFSNGFDPYNIQIMPKNYSAEPSRKFMKTNATGAVLDDGVMNGVYGSGDPAISLGDSIPTVDKNNCVWFDSRKLSVTNATWMAVQDADGNMQLMPRFDQNLRMSEFGDLIAPTSSEVAKTYTKLYRPVVYDYRFIDNDGNESIRYKSGGDLLPQTPGRFKSPFATNLTYYSDAECTHEITESLDGADLTDSKVYVRYEYDREADGQKILMGKWQTMKLNNQDVQYTTVSSTPGIYYDAATSESKPETVDSDDKKWQWKFLETQQGQPDPYAVKIYSRDKTDGAVMNTTYALLPHIVDGVSDGYMLTCMDGTTGFSYNALTGGATDATAAANNNSNSTNIVNETGYNTNCKIILTDDVEHTFTYKVYTNSGAFAISANQTQEEVNGNDWATRIPDAIKTPLLNQDQFRYYSKDKVTFGTGDPVPATDIASADTIDKNLSNLYGLYDDEVVVRYIPYDASVIEYGVPNVRNATGGTVAKGAESNDTPLDLSQTLIYNVIWYNDNMMATTDNTNVVGHANQAITTESKHEWQIGGDDPYAMTLYNVGAGKYITAASTDNNAACTLTGSATTFMLLPKDDYEYGILAITGNEGSKLTMTNDSNAGTYDDAKITTGDPAKFIIFALATHKVIYHLMIKNIGEDVVVHYYRGTDINGTLKTNQKVGTGTTMRDLTTQDETGTGHVAGDYYQLGESLKAIGTRTAITTGLFTRDSIYCHDAGQISLGDELEVPSVFYRPNVNYFFIVEGVYNKTDADEDTEMDNKYKGWQTKNMGDDPGLLGKTVFVNIVYSFDTELTTNAGSGFVTSVDQNKWYSFETNDATPRLAEYTGSLQTQSGYATHYTNDYLWTPVGDPYGFKMYNRYACKNQNQSSLVMTTASIGNVAVTMGNEGDNGERDIYELIATSTTTPGYFRVHPMVNMNKSGATQYYMNCNSSTGAITLSTVPTEWTFGLSEDVMSPYYQSAGYVGGLNEAGKTAYEAALEAGTEFEKLTSIQDIVYNHDNNPENINYIVHYAPGYYRLHSQPGSSGISTPRYASGYTHKYELTPGTGTVGSPVAIPLHFYEQTSYDVNDHNFNDLIENEVKQFTETSATRGEIPIATVASDPASIFRFSGEVSSATISTQGLNVYQNKMDASSRTAFSIIDIGGGVVALQNGVDNFLNYNQASKKYDLKFDYPASAIESARWCMQPVQKGATAGSGEMPLTLVGNNGNDKHFYTTFYAPFDALLTDAANDTAFVVTVWNDEIITPKEIGQYNTGDYAGNSQFIPANTPVIIRSKKASTASTSSINLALPTTTPASTPVSCVFKGEYLEQMLQQSYDYMSDHSADYVYVFGLEYAGTFTEPGDFATTGLINATAPSPTKELGFFKNMNRNRESSEYRSSWTRNNKYVYGNKIYYRADDPVSPARGETRGIDFVPVLFDVEPSDEEQQESQTVVGDNRVYDMLGRCVATEEQVKDGSWRQSLSKGMYILNGKKFMKKN